MNTPFKVPEVRKENSVLQIIATDEYDLAIHDEFFKAVLAVRALFHHLLQYATPPIFFICPPSSQNSLTETGDRSLDYEMMLDSDGETCVEGSDSDYEMMEETGYDTDFEMYGEPYSDDDFEMHDDLYDDEDLAHY